jgi:hypothetical protein
VARCTHADEAALKRELAAAARTGRAALAAGSLALVAAQPGFTEQASAALVRLSSGRVRAPADGTRRVP